MVVAAVEALSEVEVEDQTPSLVPVGDQRTVVDRPIEAVFSKGQVFMTEMSSMILEVAVAEVNTAVSFLPMNQSSN